MNEQEKREIRAELEPEFASGRQHPAMLAQRAVAAGDLDLAAVIVEVGWHHLSGREKASLASYMKSVTGESPKEWRARKDEAHTKATTELGEALAKRRGWRKEQQQRLAEGSVPQRGPNAVSSIEEDQAIAAKRAEMGARIEGGYKKLDGRATVSAGYSRKHG